MRILIAIAVLAGCHHGGSPPPPPTCEHAADHVASLLEPRSDRTRAVRGVFATRCRDDAWSADVRSCVVSTTSLKDPKHCKAKLPAAARARLEVDLAARKVQPIPEACREYARTVERLVTCDKIPQGARDTIRQAFDTQRELWQKGASQESIEACRAAVAAVDAMNQAAQAMGCSL